MSTHNRNKLAGTIAAVAFASTANHALGLVLEEVVVTAQKREQSLQDVPVSVSAMSADSIEKLNFVSSSDIGNQVPNLQVAGPYGDSQPIFALRGISMVDYNVNQASPVGVYIDEATAGTSYMQGFQIMDLERIEVLRGPQGTLFGKNTAGGAINFITKKPEFDNEGDVTVGFGDYDRRHLSGAAEAVLIEDTLGVRAAFTYTKTDGYHENHFPGGEDLSETDNYAVRVSARYATDNLDAVLRVFTGESDPIGNAVIPLGSEPGETNALGYARPAEYDAWEGSHDRWGKNEVELDGASLTLNWDIGEHTITSITSYSEGSQTNVANTDGAPNRVLEIDWISDMELFSQDLRLTTNFDGPFNLIAGIYYGTDETNTDNELDVLVGTEDLGIPFDPSLATSGFTFYQGYVQERTTYAAYGHSTYDFTDELTLTLGLRYTKDEGEFNDSRSWVGDYGRNWVYGIVPFTAPLDPAAVLPEESYDEGEWTGKIGVDYLIPSGGMVYGHYSRGYRSGAFNGGALLDASALTIAEPEFVDAYEIGYKSEFFDNRLRLNASLFWNDYQDQQYVNIVGDIVPVAVIENADKATLSGLELELTAQPTEKLTLHLGLGLLDAEYDEASLNDPADASITYDLSGNELLNAPKVNVNFALDYEIVSTDLFNWFLHVDTVYVDEQYFTAYNDLGGHGVNSADSYTQTNASLTLEDPDEKYRISLWVKNIEENDEPISSFSVRPTYGYDYFMAPLPRRYGVDFTYRF